MARVALEDGLASLRGQYLTECEQRRTFLWVPVIYGAGILAYFQLPREPFLPAVVCAALAAAAVALAHYRTDRSYRLWVAIAVIGAGALAAQIRTVWLSGHTIEEPFFATVTGTVDTVQIRAGLAPRIVLGDLDVDTAVTAASPNRVRVNLLKRDRLPRIGQRIRIRARLSPVPGPVHPDGYDPRRAAFFQGIGGSGFAVGLWLPEAPPPDLEWNCSPGRRISGVRQTITERILASESGQSGAVAAALLVGERGYLAEDVVTNLRNAGLAHILAISGLHMALFSGTVFFALRGLFALSPALALTRPIKKYAAVGAIAAGLGYLMISGGNVATYRAFIMAAIMFGAILVDRPAISLRNLAFAALIILAFEPESVAEPGFQMSFAAVMALIAFYEWWRNRERKNLGEPVAGFSGYALRSLKIYFGTMAMTTIVASIATAPIAIYHFNHVALYSLASNLLAMPVLAFIVMPAGLLCLLMMPFGLEGLPLSAMAVGTNMIIDVAASIGGREDSHLTVPSIHWTAFMLLVGGMVWMSLWQRPWRWIGFVFAVVAAPLTVSGRTSSDILVNASGKMVAVRDDTGTVRVSARRINDYVLEQWLRLEGLSQEEGVVSDDVSCDATACIVGTVSGHQIVHIRGFPAFAEECRRGVIIVTDLTAPSGCAADLVIDQAALGVRGAHAINIRKPEGEGSVDNLVVDIETAIPQMRRPWHGQAIDR